MKSAFIGVALAGLSLAPISALSAPVSLFHPFSVDSVGVWESESFLASSGQWRLGSVNGPIASGSEVDAVLGNLTSLGIHSTCANSDVGGLISFCGIGVSNVNLGGTATDDFADPGQTNAGWLQQAEGSPAVDAEWSAAGGNPGGYIGLTNTAFDTVPVRLSLLAPERYLGNQGTSFATGFSFCKPMLKPNTNNYPNRNPGNATSNAFARGTTYGAHE